MLGCPRKRVNSTVRPDLRCHPILVSLCSWAARCWVFDSEGWEDPDDALTCGFFISRQSIDLWVLGHKKRKEGCPFDTPLDLRPADFSRCAGWI